MTGCMAHQLSLVVTASSAKSTKLQALFHLLIWMASMVCLHSLCTSGEVLTTSIAGLICFKIVIHCIINSFFCFILGISVYDNNCSATVLYKVQTACVKNGYPHPMAALYCNTYYKSVPHVVQYNAPVHRV